MHRQRVCTCCILDGLAHSIDRNASCAVNVSAFFGAAGRIGFGPLENDGLFRATLAIDSRAAAVIGSHPHVLQGVETYKGAPIAYSLAMENPFPTPFDAKHSGR